MSEDFLSRWSRLKRSGGGDASPKQPPAPPQEASARVAAAAKATPAPAPPLPPIESLEPGADIAQFMQAKVDESLKRQAVKKLLQDPRFNVMDGLDVYIDDYSQPDPLPEGWLEKMNQTVRLGDYREPEPAEKAPEEAAAEGAPRAQDEAPQGATVATAPDAATTAPLDTPDAANPASKGTQSHDASGGRA